MQSLLKKIYVAMDINVSEKEIEEIAELYNLFVGSMNMNCDKLNNDKEIVKWKDEEEF